MHIYFDNLQLISEDLIRAFKFVSSAIIYRQDLRHTLVAILLSTILNLDNFLLEKLVADQTDSRSVPNYIENIYFMQYAQRVILKVSKSLS